MSEHTDSLEYSNTTRPADSYGQSVENSATSSTTSVIGPTLVVRGEVTAKEDLLIRGRVEGRIDHNQTLTVHAEGTVEAVVKAKEIHIEGTVKGDLFGTERVKVCETGKVIGNVCAPRVGVMEGAAFKGMVDMDSDAAAIERRYAEQLEKAGKPMKREPESAKSAPEASAEAAAAPAASQAKEKGSGRGGSRKSNARSASSAADATADKTDKTVSDADSPKDAADTSASQE